MNEVEEFHEVTNTSLLATEVDDGVTYADLEKALEQVADDKPVSEVVKKWATATVEVAEQDNGVVVIEDHEGTRHGAYFELGGVVLRHNDHEVFAVGGGTARAAERRAAYVSKALNDLNDRELAERKAPPA
jgi:hypothetical protein